MLRQAVLDQPVPPYAQRRRAIEAERLPLNLGALLDAAAAEAPDRVAWNFFESRETATYAELRRRVNRIAAGLVATGLRKGVHVAVMLPNVAAFPLTWLALARIGAVMVPMNIAYTAREIAYVVEDGDVEWAVVDAACLAGFEPAPGRLSSDRIFVVGEPPRGYRAWAALDGGTGDDFVPPDPVGPDDLLNIQYTSGTTGMPKGCMLTQRYWLTIGLVNARRDGRVYERILASTPFFYMDPQWALTMAFNLRATLFVARRQSASRFMGWVRQHRIQFALFPPIVLKQPPDSRDADNEIVRVNVYGLPRHEHAELEARYDMVAREAYGMTEIGSGMFMPIEAVDMVGSGSCGVPSPFREARIVDPAGNPVAEGADGELQIRGPGILTGYYNKPDATAAAFQDGWFRTGDLFRRDARGYYFIVGRIKDMVRRAGENIAAREVEGVLCALPEIREAAVVGVPDATRGEEVKAYVVLQPGLTPADVPPERILDHCAAGLARFKVPRYIAYRDAFPKTPSEKIAKRLIVEGETDLRLGAWDRVDGCWR
ncbi:MAG: class I adenylate-forming enzyme family protein [Alphaproteobacteria bacterium]